jgi:hypothetical protein
LKEYAATSPVGEGGGGGGGIGVAFDTVTATFAATDVFPTASRARAESVWAPLVALPVAHDRENGALVCSAPTATPSSKN